MFSELSVGIRLRASTADRAPPELVKELRLSTERAMPLSAFQCKLSESPNYNELIASAWQNGYLEILDNSATPTMAGYALSSSTCLDLSALDRSSRWILSRFALLHREADELILESARTGSKIVIYDSTSVLACAAFRTAHTLDELMREVPKPRNNLADLTFVLRATGLIIRYNGDGDSDEGDASLTQWELHDMFLHTRSRLVRAAEHELYRFRGKLAPQPAIKQNPWLENSTKLPRVDLEKLLVEDPPFTRVLEGRRSERIAWTDHPISLDQVSEFLFRVARIRDISTHSLGEFTSRPYPSGGASYELELYLAINSCHKFSRGLYYYDALHHALSRVPVAASDLNELLVEAWVFSGEQYVPQILIIIASRFQRVAWKYSPMAYATQLKNVGILMQTMYLVATAMGLAPCALGSGDAARFSRIVKLDPFCEGSIGEFLIGACGSCA